MTQNEDRIENPIITNEILLQSGECISHGVYQSSMHITNGNASFGTIHVKMLCGAYQMGRVVRDFGVSFAIWCQGCTLWAIIDTCSSLTCKWNTLLKGSTESCQHG